MNEIKRQILDEVVKTANERIDPVARLVYFDRDTESGNARVILYTEGDAYGRMVAVGSPRECWQFLRGFVAALDVA